LLRFFLFPRRFRLSPIPSRQRRFRSNFFRGDSRDDIDRSLYNGRRAFGEALYVRAECREYALLSLVGKVIFFLGIMPNMFMVTFVGRNRGLGKGTKSVFRIIYSISAIIVTGSVLVFGFFGETFATLLFGEKILQIASFLPMYTAAIAFFTLSTIIVTYHLARKRYVFVFAALCMSLAEAVGIYRLHWSLDGVVWVVFLSSFFGWVLLEFLHFSEPSFQFFGRAYRDFLGAFRGRSPEGKLSSIGKRVLIFNWRDTRHAYSGGAEVYVEEIAKRWVSEGHTVTLFCGNDGKSPRHETRDGIRIVRRGGFYLVYAWAFVYYFTRFRGKYDVILDCENGIPFFTPFYVKEPVVCLLHHVHQDVFFRFLPKPLAMFASFLEKTLMPLVYARVPFVTVSQSSRKDMEALGIGKAGIRIVHPGVHLDEFVPSERKTDRPTILYLGRLKAYKSIDVLLRAFRSVIAERPEAELIIAGDGDEESALKRLAFEELRLGSERVRFVGHVSEEKKKALLQDAWMLINPSMMEGWGIVAIEANACGTPVVASDVPGLRDSVKNPHSGFLVPYGDADAFAEKMLLLIRDRELRLGMNRGAREWAERFDWNVSSKLMFEAISVSNDERVI
jgi:glycosyltransferase involved in cell wall biosynthesis